MLNTLVLIQRSPFLAFVYTGFLKMFVKVSNSMSQCIVAISTSPHTKMPTGSLAKHLKSCYWGSVLVWGARRCCSYNLSTDTPGASIIILWKSEPTKKIIGSPKMFQFVIIYTTKIMYRPKFGRALMLYNEWASKLFSHWPEKIWMQSTYQIMHMNRKVLKRASKRINTSEVQLEKYSWKKSSLLY